MLEISVKAQKNELLTADKRRLERYAFDGNGNHTVFEITKDQFGYHATGEKAEFDGTSITQVRKVCDLIANEWFAMK